MNNQSSDILVTKISRANTLKSFFRAIVSSLLNRYSKKYLEEGRKQLVVFSFDHISHEINLNGLYERNELDAFFSWLKVDRKYIFDNTAIDIGANIGNHSLYFSDIFKNVIGFEPNDRTYGALMLNAKLAKNIVVHNIGISNTERDGTLNINHLNIGGSSLSGSFTGFSQTVKLCPLDSIVSYDQQVSLIKIDVEGHEYEVIQGSKSVIERNRPIVMFEQHKSDFVQGRSRVIDLLKDLGYKKFVTIKHYPKSIQYFPKVIRYPLTAVQRLLFGDTLKISIEETITPDFYNFIAAMPN